MPERIADPDVSPSPPRETDMILVADPSAEGEAIASVLRARDYVVIDVPLALLEARTAGDGARVIVIDVEQTGAAEAIERIREIDASSEIHVFCLGDLARAAELGATRANGRAFERPVDVDALAAAITEVAGPARRERRARGTTPPPSYAPRRETSPPIRRESDSPPSFTGGGDPLELGGILPGVEEDIAGGKPGAEMSPELAQVLEAAEQRVLGNVLPSSTQAPEEDVDLILSPDLLLALDEPLDPDDEDLGTGSGAQQGTAQPRGTTGAAGTGTLAQGTVTGAAAMTSAGAAMSSPAIPAAAGSATATPATGMPSVRDSWPRDTGLGLRRADTRPPTFGGESRTNAPESDSFAGSARTPPPRSIDALDAGAPRFSTQEMPAISRVPVPSGGAMRGARPEPKLPAVLGEGDGLRAVARAIAARLSGSLALGTEATLRRIVLHDGDIVTAGSGAADESLVAFLVARGDLEREAASKVASKLPPFGRHAGAALIANGHLKQDDLWPVLRAHAEWLIGRAIECDEGTCELEPEPPGRLRAEPNVFGGATGAEVLVETVRRMLDPDAALRRLGGASARVDEGPHFALLGECALRPAEEDLVRYAKGKTVGEIIQGAEPEAASVLHALSALGILDVLAPPRSAESARERQFDPLDEEALRQRVRARHALVEDGDYFALLGVPRSATGYEVRRAYLELRRAFEPARVLTAATADLADQVRLVVEVLDEAYEILKDAHRRERYRKAIEAVPAEN